MQKALDFQEGGAHENSYAETNWMQQNTAKHHFGTYCEVHDKPDPSNSIVPHTQQTIAMRLTGNLQGSHKFLCQKTGKNYTKNLDINANAKISH